jgi:aminocarboxymuconate-semialdehyde decarboxylase
VALPELDSLIVGAPGLSEFRDLENRRYGLASWSETTNVVRERRAQLVSPDARIQYMDQQGVDTQVVSINPTQFHYWTADRVLASDISAATNEGVRDHCATNPQRLVGLGAVPLQHPELTVEWLEHAMSIGLRGIEISTHAPGETLIELSDPRLEPLWFRAEELGAVVLVHPMGCTLDERLDQWYLSNTVGQPVETAVALAHIIFSGVLDRHPALKLIFAHGGGYLPAYFARSDHAWRNRIDAHSCEELPSSYLRRVFVDTVVFDPRVLRSIVDIVGAGNVLLGTDSPYDMGDPHPLDTLSAIGAPQADVDLIAGGNAQLLGLLPDREHAAVGKTE